ncbi:MAG: hypothetical protein HC918_02765 [Oscillatoriales cyanobacterium SM2_1_8]|nr:hypothetical protein [Oscillatoriales cyanobacterium SM2_1_8]
MTMEPIAEVVTVSTVEVVAQCFPPPTLDFPAVPPLGSWVAIDDGNDDGDAPRSSVLAVVYFAETVPMDGLHRPVALGLSLAELRSQQPQVFATLKTEFRALVVGFRRDRRVYHHLPAQPPRLHQMVRRCTIAEVQDITANPTFVRSLLRPTHVPTEELVAAVLRQAYRDRQGDRPWLVQVGKQLALLLGEDYDRLTAILERVYL